MGCVDRTLFDHLRACRSDLATQRGVPAYVIFNDQVLRQLASARPTRIESIASMKGVGTKNLEAFAETFLAALDSFCTEHSLSRDQTLAKEITIETVKPSRPRAAEEASAMFATGKSVEQVATALNRASSTVNGYLQNYLRDEGISDPRPWIATDELEAVDAAIEADPENKQLRTVYEALGERVSYNDIRVVMTCRKNRKEMDPSNSAG